MTKVTPKILKFIIAPGTRKVEGMIFGISESLCEDFFGINDDDM